MAAIGFVLLAAPEFRSWAYDPFGNYAEVSLSRLQSNPSAYKNTRVEFTCILNKIEKLWAHFYTPFTADDYMAFSVWDVERMLWVKEDFVSDFPFVFIRKDSEYLSTILHAPRFAVLKLSCIVQNDFNNIPWLEVIRARVAERGHHTDQSLRAMISAVEHFQKKEYRAAVAEFKNALAVNLPRYDEGRILKQLATAQYLLGDYEDAWRSARRGLRIFKDDPEFRRLKEAAAEAAGRKRAEEFKQRLEERRNAGQAKAQPLQVETQDEPKTPEPEPCLDPDPQDETRPGSEPVPPPDPKDETDPHGEQDKETGRDARQGDVVSITDALANRRIAQLESILARATSENRRLRLVIEDLAAEVKRLRIEVGDAAARNVTLCAELAVMKLKLSEKDTTIATLGQKLDAAYREIHKTLRKDDYAALRRRRDTGPLGPGQAMAGRVEHRTSSLRRFTDDEIRKEVESYLHLAQAASPLETEAVSAR